MATLYSRHNTPFSPWEKTSSCPSPLFHCQGSSSLRRSYPSYHLKKFSPDDDARAWHIERLPPTVAWEEQIFQLQGKIILEMPFLLQKQARHNNRAVATMYPPLGKHEGLQFGGKVPSDDGFVVWNAQGRGHGIGRESGLQHYKTAMHATICRRADNGRILVFFKGTNNNICKG